LRPVFKTSGGVDASERPPISVAEPVEIATSISKNAGVSHSSWLRFTQYTSLPWAVMKNGLP
jgi:hypothetical protein